MLEEKGRPVMKLFEFTEEAKQALCRQAPEFTEIASREELHSFQCCGDLFLALVQSIVAQQLSVKAADTIFHRLETLLGKISSETILEAAVNDLRSCGLSGRKVAYLKGVAEAERSGAIDFNTLASEEDSVVIEKLVQLKGVGVWTAEMLLISALGRPDILSYKDLGIRRGIMMLYGLETLSETEFEVYRRRYSPYGTLASFYLWRIKDGGLTIKTLK